MAQSFRSSVLPLAVCLVGALPGVATAQSARGAAGGASLRPTIAPASAPSRAGFSATTRTARIAGSPTRTTSARVAVRNAGRDGSARASALLGPRASAALGAGGATARSRATPSGRPDAGFARLLDRTVQVRTGLGNPFTVTARTGEARVVGADHMSRPLEVAVSYRDTADRFRGYNVVTAFVFVQTSQRTAGDGPRNQSAPVTGSRQLTLTLVRQPDGSFVGRNQIAMRGVAGRSESQVEHMQLAFGIGGRWDSDYGRNYRAF